MYHHDGKGEALAANEPLVYEEDGRCVQQRSANSIEDALSKDEVPNGVRERGRNESEG